MAADKTYRQRIVRDWPCSPLIERTFRIAQIDCHLLFIQIRFLREDLKLLDSFSSSTINDDAGRGADGFSTDARRRSTAASISSNSRSTTFARRSGAH
jgi:hypothetical protein